MGLKRKLVGKVMKFGELVRQHRKSCGICQDALSKACGVSQPSISKIENNAVLPDLETGLKMIVYLGMDLKSVGRVLGVKVNPVKNSDN